MPFGSVFSKFPYIRTATADSRRIEFKNNFITKIGFLVLGIPHIGLRLRARKISKNIPKRTGRMLDAGCGAGIYSFSLADKADSIEAVDIDGKKIDYAKKINLFKNIKFSVQDIKKLKFKNKSFDLIICSDVLEHIKDDEKAFSELARVLDNNGKLLITLPFASKKNILTYKRYNHERPGYSLESIKNLCRKYGLIVDKREAYSREITEKFSVITDEKIKNRLLLGILFYPLYWLCLLTENIFCKSEPNGIFFKLIKKD